MKGRKLVYWMGGIACAALAHASIYWAVAFFHPFEKEFQEEEKGALSIEVLDSIKSEMDLFDPRPLLLPTRWNAANAERLGDFFEEEKPIFSEYSYGFGGEQNSMVALYGNRWEVSGDAATLGLSFGFPKLDQLWVKRKPLPSTPQPALRLRLVDPGSGKAVFEGKIASAEAEEFERTWPGWSPVVFIATYLDSFLVSGFAILEGSGYGDLDIRLEQLAFERLLQRGFFADGSYLVEIGF